MLYKRHVESFSRVGDSGIAIGHCKQLLFSRNLGRTWELLGELPEQSIIKQIVWLDSTHIVVTSSFSGSGKVYYSCDGGRSYSLSLPNTASSEAVVWDTMSGLLYAADNTPLIYVSSDTAKTWTAIGNRIPFEKRPRVSHVCSLASFSENGKRTFYVTTSYPGEIFYSSDKGRSWSRIFSDSTFRNREIPKIGELQDHRYFAVSAEGVMDVQGKVLLGSKNRRHWRSLPVPEGLWYFGELPSKRGFLVVGGFSLGKNAGNAAMFVSDNYGRTWTPKKVLDAALVWKIECTPPDSWLLATDKGLLQLNIHSLY